MQDRFAWPLMCWWLALGAAVVVVRLLSEGIIDTGDGVNHYLIARFAPQHPENFLDPWGKPLFTLLSAPFAQLGLWGMTLFNALCFVGTAWAADGVLRRSPVVARWLFAPALVLMPEYCNVLLSGLTEALFAMIVMIVVRCYCDRRWMLGTLFASLLPFARPEFYAVLPFIVAWLAWQRQWRVLPWLLFGNLLHAVAAWAIEGDLLWAISARGYGDASSIYGHGYLLHFVDRLDLIMGPGVEWLLVLSIPLSLALAYGLPKEREEIARTWGLLLLPFLAILVGHSILWWQGWKGSLGLLRTITTGAPLALLFVAWTLGRAGSLLLKAPSVRTIVGVLIASLYFAGTCPLFLRIRPLPVGMDEQQNFFAHAGDEMRKCAGEHSKAIIFHPYLQYRSGLDVFDRERVLRTSDHDDPEELFNVPIGTFVAWDAHLGSNEGGTPLAELLDSGRFAVKGFHVPLGRDTVLGGLPSEIWFFERRDTRYQHERLTLFPLPSEGRRAGNTRLDTLACSDAPHGTLCFKADEFPLDLSELPMLGDRSAYSEISVSGELVTDKETAKKILFVFSEENDEGKLTYWPFTTHPDEFEFSFRVPERTPDVRAKIYLWNRSGREFRLNNLRIVHTRIREAP